MNFNLIYLLFMDLYAYKLIVSRRIRRKKYANYIAEHRCLHRSREEIFQENIVPMIGKVNSVRLMHRILSYS